MSDIAAAEFPKDSSRAPELASPCRSDPCVDENGQRITGQWFAGEGIKLDEFVSARVHSSTLLLPAAKSNTAKPHVNPLRAPAKRNYYARLLETIESMPGVRFRRIIRNSDSNRRWLSELLPRLAAKCPNADVGLLKEGGREEMPLSLSVQLVDSTQTWLVALETHEGSSKYRDIFIESAEFNSAMSGYYERLWNRSEDLLKQGTLTPAGRKVIEELRDGTT